MRMQITKSRKNNYVIVIAFAFLIGAIFFYTQKNGNADYALHGKITYAQIIDVLDSKTARYEYQVNNQIYTGEANIEFANYMHVEIKKGRTIQIEYLENDPKTSRVYIAGLLRGSGIGGIGIRR